MNKKTIINVLNLWSAILMVIVTYNLIGLYNSIDKPIDRDCEVVNGNGHIYKGQCLPLDFKPEVVPLSPRANWLNTTRYLDIKAKVLVEQLINDAEKDGMCLVVMSGYRSYKDQSDLYYNTVEDKREFVALPGSSEHQTGLAVDFGACPMNNKGIRDDNIDRQELANEFDMLPEYLWLLDNASKYGFEQSFKDSTQSITGYPREPWHWKLVIKEL